MNSHPSILFLPNSVGRNERFLRTLWNQQIDVVASYIVLCQPHNRALQTLLTMMVCGMLRHIASQLSHLNMGIRLREANEKKV